MTSRGVVCSTAAATLMWMVTVLQFSTGLVAAPHAAPELPERLSQTGRFVPQYPLWSDGASKTRWVYLPPSETIRADGSGAWHFPVGTKFWKEFAFAGRKIETRLLWKAAPDRWVVASYAWNDEQSDATLAPDEGLWGIAQVAPGKRHSIPSRADCLACHSATNTGPLGFNPLQLSPDRDPNAIHGEPPVHGMVTLQTLSDAGRLSLAPGAALPSQPRIRTNDPVTRAMLGYLLANCGHCHNGNGEIAALAPILKMSELLADGDAVARGLVDRPTKWQVPGLPEGASVVVSSHGPEQSALLARMRSRQPSSQMPPLGTVLRDQKAIDAITAWVASRRRAS
jgi:cytochrome c553